MKILKKFPSHSSVVELVEIQGKKFVLKTVSGEEACNEKRFLTIMRENNLPTIEVIDYPNLSTGQILLEYVSESKKAISESIEDAERWGSAIQKMHEIHFKDAFTITAENTKKNWDWNDFLKHRLEIAIQRQISEKSDLSNEFLNDIRAWVTPKLNIKRSEFSLLHGDLHDGNTLDKNGEVVLFDKSSEIFSGDPLYDLVIFLTHYPNGIYVETDFTDYKNDALLLKHFMKGYKNNFIENNKDVLDVYMVIRALDRYPNHFEIFNKQIIESIIYKPSNY